MFLRRLELWPAATNTYLVAPAPGGPAVLVDAPPDCLDPIQELLADHDLIPVALLVTHGHVDHVGGAGHLTAHTGVTAYIHPEDDFLTSNPTDQLLTLMGMVPPGDFSPPHRYRELSDGLSLDLAGLRFEVLATPGHTPGHCCFLIADEGVLFSGDQLFAGSIGRTDLPGGDYFTLMESMKTKVLPLDDQVEVMPGHGSATTIGRERRFNPFLIGEGI
ncbi:MAG: MBL fold metallo-hydrolase [Acidimicrobiia bacterium]|nr:MBL fold metallo-hydrolase [Acidimicrobiia bacterium]